MNILHRSLFSEFDRSRVLCTTIETNLKLYVYNSFDKLYAFSFIQSFNSLFELCTYEYLIVFFNRIDHLTK